MRRVSQVDDDEIVSFVRSSAAPHSGYILDNMRRSGIRISSPVLLRKLKKLAEEGKLKQSKSSFGFYGYRWDPADE